MTRENFDIALFWTILIILAINIIIYIISRIIRRRFAKKYGMKTLPPKTKLRLCPVAAEENKFELNFPYWAVRKSDGTADKRIKNNRIIWPNSVLKIDKYFITSEMPMDIIKIVKKIRLSGTKVSQCKEEKVKLTEIVKSRQKVSNINDIQALVDNFAENPTDFEWLCAEMFESIGYTSRLTPPTNDGGYDILLRSNAGTAIVECK